MSERLGFDVEIEGAEEAIKSLNTMLGDISRVTSLVGTADYAFSSWQRSVEEFDVVSFTRSLIATITLMRSLIAVTQMATATQEALNMAQAQTKLTQFGVTAPGVSPAGAVAGVATSGTVASISKLLGPIGAILAVTLTTYSIVNTMNKNYELMAEKLRRDAEDRQFNRRLYEDALAAAREKATLIHEEPLASIDEIRREKYRSVGP